MEIFIQFKEIVHLQRLPLTRGNQWTEPPHGLPVEEGGPLLGAFTLKTIICIQRKSVYRVSEDIQRVGEAVKEEDQQHERIVGEIGHVTDKVGIVYQL